MSIVQISDRRDRTSSIGANDDRDLFVGPSIPKDVQQCIKRLTHLSKADFRKILQVLVSSLEGQDVDVTPIREMTSEKLLEDDVHHIYTGLLTLLQLALRLPQTPNKQQIFTEDLLQMRVPEDFVEDLMSVVFGNRRPKIESSILSKRPRLPTLERLKWRVDVAISTSVLNRVLEPTILMEMTTSDKKLHKFEVPVSKFSQLRYNVAYILKEMEQLEKRSILKIQD